MNEPETTDCLLDRIINVTEHHEPPVEEGPDWLRSSGVHNNHLQDALRLLNSVKHERGHDDN